jgi:aromatic ring-cleaving dioxygenase
VTFHPHVLTSPDRAAVVEENRHFISNRAMVTSVHMQPNNKMGPAPQNGIVEQDFLVWGTRKL